jgi:hypothetical protein
MEIVSIRRKGEEFLNLLDLSQLAKRAGEKKSRMCGRGRRTALVQARAVQTLLFVEVCLLRLHR